MGIGWQIPCWQSAAANRGNFVRMDPMFVESFLTTLFNTIIPLLVQIIVDILFGGIAAV